MILVHLPQSWPLVLAGELTAAEATLGDWAGISDEAIATFGDAVVGIYNNTVVTAFDTTGWKRTDEGRVRFAGTDSHEWAHLVFTPNPGKPWGVRGMARPVQYLDSTVVAGGDVPIDETLGGRRAVVDGYILTVALDGATVVVPAGRSLTVMTTVAARDDSRAR